MQTLQVRVGPMQRIAVAIAGQGGGVLEPVAAHDVGRPRPGAGVFVDVVAQEQGQVRRLVGHVAIGAEIADLPVRAGGDGQLQPIHVRIRRRRRAGQAHRAALAGGGEPIPVGAAGGQALDLHMDRMGGGGIRRDLARGDDAGKALVGGDVPAHRDGRAQTALSVGGDRIDGQPRPQHETVRPRIAAGHAQREQIGPARPGPAEAQHDGGGDQPPDQGAAGEAGVQHAHRPALPAAEPGPKRARKSSRRMTKSSLATKSASLIWGCSLGL